VVKALLKSQFGQQMALSHENEDTLVSSCSLEPVLTKLG